MTLNASPINSVPINAGVSSSAEDLRAYLIDSFGDALIVYRQDRYDFLRPLAASRSDLYGELPPLVAYRSDTYGELPALAASRSDLYGELPPLVASRLDEYEFWEPLKASRLDRYDFLAESPFVAYNLCRFTLSGEPSEAQAPVVVLADGVEIDYVSVEVAQEEGGYWVATLSGIAIEDLVWFPVGGAFSVWLDDEAFRFYVDRTSRQAQFGAPEISINGLSVAVDLDAPRADSITKTWDTPAMASAIAEELLGAIDWQMIDWPIRPYRFAAQDGIPIAVARELIEKAGGVLDIQPDGSTKARPEYPVPVRRWVDAVPDIELSEFDHVFVISSQAAYGGVIDRVRIYDSEADVFQDRLEFDADPTDPLLGIVHVYPSPWRESIEVITSAGDRVALQRIGVSGREMSQQIEFQDGLASTSHPVAALTSVEWITDSLGALTHEAYGAALQAVESGWALAEVKYLTRSIDYRATASQKTAAQLLVRDVGG